MASRPVVQHNARGEVARGGGKMKNGGGEGGNRRALNDIGNLVTVRGAEGKLPLTQPTRPVTRSFCAQLLANAQAAAVVAGGKNKLKPSSKGGAIPKGVKVHDSKAVKIAVVKPAHKKPLSEDDIIVISPSPCEVHTKTKKEFKSSRRREVKSLSSILTARSKAACGIRYEAKVSKVENIDAGDESNELAVVEYVEDMYKFYKDVETENQAKDYIKTQPEINERMRSILVNWLIDVHLKFGLTPESLYLTVNIIDRYLSVEKVLRKELQLLGMGAMLAASKYEEIWAPEVNDFVYIADKAYTNGQIIGMEKTILRKLEWTLTVPTPYVFLSRYIKASTPDAEMENMVFFMAELGLVNYATVMLPPSLLAASAVYAARCTLSRSPVWTDTLRIHTGYDEINIMECAKLLAGYHSMAADNNLKAVYKKYSAEQRGLVALLPPAKALLPPTNE